MQRQGSFSQVEYAGKKQTRRDKFLAEMEQVRAVAAGVRLQPLYPKRERGRLLIRALETRCGVTFCSNGMGWPTRRWRPRCTTVRPRAPPIALPPAGAGRDESAQFRHWWSATI